MEQRRFDLEVSRRCSGTMMEHEFWARLGEGVDSATIRESSCAGREADSGYWWELS